MKLLNIDEEIPEVFYIFIGQGKNIYSKINYHNYCLNKRIVSSGFQGLFTEPSKVKDFLDGNIVYAPFVPNDTTLNVPSSHQMAVVNGYYTEYVLEYVRFTKFKHYPSRFSCVFAFGNYESCQKANKYYNWDLKKVKKFKLVKNTHLDPCIKVAKCNMEIVTEMWNCDIASFDRESIDRIAIAYWNGIGQVATEREDIDTRLRTQRVCGEIYEYLIEGILEEIE